MAKPSKPSKPSAEEKKPAASEPKKLAPAKKGKSLDDAVLERIVGGGTGKKTTRGD